MSGVLTRFVEWNRLHPFGGDAALVAALLLTLWVLGGAADGFTTLLVLPLLARRAYPVAMFTAVSLLLFAQVLFTDDPQAADVVLLLALYAVAAYGPAWAAWGGLATGVLGAVLGAVQWFAGGRDLPALAFGFVTLTTMVAASWLLGMLARTRRAYVAGLEERAVRLEHEAAQQAQIAAAAERARIAREMHDVVAHSISVMVVQADGALYASRTRPEAAAAALHTISRTGRTSLTEMRRLLGLLRADGTSEGAERAPLPTAVDVPALVESVRESGLSVALELDGDLASIPSAPGLTVYRVVQEALTNTLRHGGPYVSARVELVTAPDAVTVVVDDDGRGGSVTSDGRGHGLLGLRERIAVHTGEVDAGPRPGGGFRVRATIPWEVRG